VDPSNSHSSWNAQAEKVSQPAASQLEIRDLSLTLGGRQILDEVSFSVLTGEIVGILGPNGSGKTSLMRCITGLWRPDHGNVWLGGVLLDRSGRTKRAEMGVVFQEPSLDIKLTAWENLILGGRLFGISRKDAASRADELLAFVELTDRKGDKVETFSGGMKRRLELARSLINEPKVLLLDEPTSGLDPIAYEGIWKRFVALRKARDLSLLLSTHRTDEAARCDRLLIFDRGRVVTCDTPENLLSRLAGDVIILETSHGEDVRDELRERFKLTAQLGREVVNLRTDGGHELIPRIVEAFPAGIFRSISLRKPSLADAFFQLTGHSLEDDEGDI
jgi:ABC-2 type transport system ATP-binding protein